MPNFFPILTALVQGTMITTTYSVSSTDRTCHRSPNSVGTAVVLVFAVAVGVCVDRRPHIEGREAREPFLLDRAPANKMPSQMRKSGAAGLLELTSSTKVPLVGYGQAGIHKHRACKTNPRDVRLLNFFYLRRTNVLTLRQGYRRKAPQPAI